jgi:hypothetical protein
MTDELELLNEIWNRAWLENDAAAVERMIGKDYIYFAPNGQVLDREATLSILKSPSCRLKKGTRTEISVKRLGEAGALVMHRWRGEGSFEGKSFTDDDRCTMVCIREGSGWRIIHEQCSPITA